MKLSKYLPMALIAGVALASCQEDMENFDNTVYLTATNPVTTVFVKRMRARQLMSLSGSFLLRWQTTTASIRWMLNCSLQSSIRFPNRPV